MEQIPPVDGATICRVEIPLAAPPYDDEMLVGAELDNNKSLNQDGTWFAHSPLVHQPDLTAGWPRQFAQVLAETLAGARPARQLAPWTTDQARRQMSQLGLLESGHRPRVRRIMASAPSQDVLEMTAVVGFGSRVRVLAVRLERNADTPQRNSGDRHAGTQWRCTQIQAA
jgi:hypothetical protein